MWNDANKLYQTKDYEKALEIYQKAEKNEPRGLSKAVNASQYKETKKVMANRYYREALSSAENGEINKAINLLQKAAELDPENTDIREALQKTQSRKDDGIKKADSSFAQGVAHLNEKNWRAAIKSFDEAIKSNRNFIAAYGKKQVAINERNKDEGLFASGMELFNAGKIRASLNVFQEAKAYDPFHPQIDEMLKKTEERIFASKKSFAEAEQFRLKKNWSEAGKLYAKTLGLDSVYPEAPARKEEVEREEKAGAALYEQGAGLLAGKKLNSAVKTLNECKAQSPYHGLVDSALKDVNARLAKTSALHAKAEAYINEQKHGETISTLEELLSIYPYDEKASISLAKTYSSTNKFLESAELYANLAVVRKKTKNLAENFTFEDGEKSPNLTSYNEDITPVIDLSSKKIYERTKYELEIITKDKRGGTANEGTIGQSILTGFSAARPANLSVSSRGFAKLSPDEHGKDGVKTTAPGKFAMAIEVTDIMPDEIREETPLTKDYISHYETEPNPEYDVAVNNYQTESNNYNAAMNDYRIKKADIDRRAQEATRSGGFAGIMASALISGLYAGLAQPTRDRINSAKTTLDNTPRTIKKPIHEIHYYNEVTVTRKVSVTATGNLTGHEFESPEDWQEDVTASGKFFDSPNTKAGIERISLKLPGNKELTENALKKLGQKIQAVYAKRLKEFIIDGYIEKGKKNVNDGNLLGAYENYFNALFIDPSLAVLKLAGSKDAKTASLLFDTENIRLIENKIKTDFKETHGEEAFVLPLK